MNECVSGAAGLTGEAASMIQAADSVPPRVASDGKGRTRMFPGRLLCMLQTSFCNVEQIALERGVASVTNGWAGEVTAPAETPMRSRNLLSSGALVSQRSQSCRWAGELFVGFARVWGVPCRTRRL